ncbi:hypothetical protein [Breznakiella homolactica]|uniref:SMI1/KNR4 family protein n=1 Tax=Breznakiella homolactica TaxID=2798577 RepID=A0A7T7XLP7_9SPIR|nr:hypothetical protein [Breznakiella homolactica]QQO08714.1 hypothetical protein JFL75_17575 [Breznakiella homolactica]
MNDKTMEILEKYLDKDFRVSPMAPNKSTMSGIDKMQKDLGIQLPEEYIAHLLGGGSEVLGERGLYIEVKEDVWPRPKQYDVGPFWSFLYGIHTFTASKESEDWMRLDAAGKDFLEETGIKAVPILRIIGDADVYCVNEAGKIARYNHEENILEEMEMDFWELFDRELKALRERKEKKIKELNK